ncbi:MAG: hypothetical protein IRY98_10975 [Alicyclobacillaceae bacterium]|nr:hypothetical protein [Alicyclobacillaceae bacterium]
MLIHPRSVVRRGLSLVVYAPEARIFAERWRREGCGPGDLSIRWAAAREGQVPRLVIGIRCRGKGFDVLLRQEDWDLLLELPEMIEVVYGDAGESHTMEKESGKSAGSDRPEETGIRVAIPPDSFDAFIDACREEAERDPAKEMLGRIAAFFTSE